MKGPQCQLYGEPVGDDIGCDIGEDGTNGDDIGEDGTNGDDIGEDGADCGLNGDNGAVNQVGAPVGLNIEPHTTFTGNRPSGHDALSAYGKYASRGTNAYAATDPKDTSVSFKGCPSDETACHTFSCRESHGTLALLKHPAIH